MDTSISQCYTTTDMYTKEDLIDDTENPKNLTKSINTDNDATDEKPETMKSGLFNFKTDVIWYIALQLALLHGIGIYSTLTFNYLKNPMTTLWIIGMYIISNLGVSAGAHRLWSHKCYKAKVPLRILLLICFSACAQNTICKWVKNHRMHHKYCDTSADPHNTQRGFFYTHIGWVMMKEDPKFTEKKQTTQFVRRYVRSRRSLWREIFFATSTLLRLHSTYDVTRVSLERDLEQGHYIASVYTIHDHSEFCMDHQ